MTATKIMLIGGCGYVGVSLCRTLLREHYDVVLVDLSPCPTEIETSLPSPSWEYYQGSATDRAFLERVITKTAPDLVIIIASWGMCGVDMLDKNCYQINVGIVEAVVATCVECAVPRLVYTSTYNVVFGGAPLANGDESLPPFPVELHTDCYSASKYMAEAYILQSNGKKLNLSSPSNGISTESVLTTCSLRPAAIYGPGEQRHLPRILNSVDSGLFVAKIGNATVDWVHIDNLCAAYLAVSRTLLKPIDTVSSVGGQSYFISDGSPMSSFGFLRPLCAARGQPFPTTTVPTSVAATVAVVFEQAHLLAKALGVRLDIVNSTLFIRAEVYKVGVTHYFSIAKAARELGYKPLFDSTEGMRRLAQYYEDELRSAVSRGASVRHFRFAPLFVWLLVCLPMAQLLLTACDAATQLTPGPVRTLLLASDYVVLKVVPNRTVHLYIFWLALLVHACEAVYSMHVARSIGLDKGSSMCWGLQTLVLGYGSFKHLLEFQAFLSNKG